MNRSAIRIAVLHLFHETVTFLKNETTLDEPEQPFLGTTRLDELSYENVDLMQCYPYGNPAFPA